MPASSFLFSNLSGRGARSLLICSVIAHLFFLIMPEAFAPHFQRFGLLISSGFLILAVGLAVRDLLAYETSNGSANSSIASLANFGTDLYWETGLEGKISFVGGRLLPALSEDPSSMIGKYYRDIVQLDDAEAFKMLTALQGHQPYSDIQSTMHGPDGRRYFVSFSGTPQFGKDGQIKGYIGVGTNVTNRVRNQKQIRHMAEHDMLTGIANRYAFTSRLTEDMKTRAQGETLALLVVDLDGFKNINDTYGHQAGDALLKMVARRLTTQTREEDWAARLGGDEFVVVSRFLANPMSACLVAERLTVILSRPYKLGGIKLVVKASIGVACTSEASVNIDGLMKRADLAMYRAKSEGKGCFRLFEADPPAELLLN